MDCGTFDPSAATGKLSVSLWARWNGPTGRYQGLIGKRDFLSADEMMWQVEASRNAGTLGFFREGSYPYTGDPVLPIAEWAHVAATFDGSVATFYFNGNETGSGPFSFGSDTQARVVFGASGRYGVNAFCGALDDVRLYDQALSRSEIAAVMTVAGTDITAPGDVVRGVPDDGDWPGNERPDMAIDDDVNTKYLHFKGDERPSGLQITPAVGPTVVTGLTLTTANDFAGRDPIAFELYGSNDSINGPYTLIARGDIADFNQQAEWPRWAMNATIIAFENAVAYEHYQLLFTAIRGPVGGFVDSMQIAEIELLAAVTVPRTDDLTAPGDVVRGVPNDGDWPGNETPASALDDNVNTKYLHFKGDERPTGLQITPAVGATIVTGLTFTTANDYPGRDPIAFELYGSTGSINGPYTLIASGDMVDFDQPTAWPRFTTNATKIAFENAVAYDHYQLLFPAIRGPVGGFVDSMQIAEIELLGLVAP